MAERREDRADRTIRPDRPIAAEHLPTVRQVLALDAFAAGRPELFADAAALDARVRWVHVSDSAGVARLLDGGELLLSTGQGWPTEPAELGAFVSGLVDAGLSCLMLELGTHYRYLPAVVIETARARGLALAALRQEVRFVQLTEAVHRRIIADQSAALRARDEVRTRFTALALRGSPADFIVHQLAQTLAAPIVLENLAHEVVVAEVPPAHERDLLDGWEARSRRAHRAAAGPAVASAAVDLVTAEVPAAQAEEDDWLIVPVEARGIRWGYLIALPGPEHPAGRAGVVEQAAIALALARLTDSEGEEWTRIGRRGLLDDLLAGRFTAHAAATARVEAAGFPVDGAQSVGLVIVGHSPAAPSAADAAARTLGGRALVGGSQSGGSMRVLLSLPAHLTVDDALISRFVHALPQMPDRVVVSVGSVAHGLEAGLASLQWAVELSRSTPPRGWSGLQIRRAEDRPLARLVSSLRDDHRMLEHGERMLAPLIEYDLARGGDLLEVLGAMLAHPGNRTAAAAASHLSRSVFYQRIALIQELLGADLDDGEQLTALHLALLVRSAAAARPAR